MKFICVYFNTDSNHPDVSIKIVRCPSQLKKWEQSHSVKMSAGSDENATLDRNWHHRVPVVYEIPDDIKIPSPRELLAKHKKFIKTLSRPWEHQKSSSELLWSWAMSNGKVAAI